MNTELWIGFVGTIISAAIGGLVAYLIAKLQFSKQEKQFRISEKKDKIKEQKYISETLKFIMRDLRNFFKLLDGKQSEVSTEKSNELDLLWERASQLLIFLINVYKKLAQFNKQNHKDATKLYDESIELINKHKEMVQKKKAI